MNYFADFDRHGIGERNEGIRREVKMLRWRSGFGKSVSLAPAQGWPPSPRRARCPCYAGRGSRARRG